jgi:hypothetical protein
MKAFLSKLLFVLAIVGIIAVCNLMWPNPNNDILPSKPTTEADSEYQSEPEPEAE